MRILVTNDDGISAQGLWALVRELTRIAQVIVVAPDKEQSAIGTAVTLRRPLQAQKIEPPVPGVEAYSVDGTPSDSVILALTKLAENRADLVISGINQGPNLGDDVLISGTVAAAIQGYLHGFPALAISVDSWDGLHLNGAARLAALLVKKIESNAFPDNIFLNVNLPNLPSAEIKGAKITRLARESHIDTVEEGHDGTQAHYWLIRHRANKDGEGNTDISAINQGIISITPLHTELFQKPAPPIPDSLCSELLQELQRGIP